ncbi:MAG: type VI secretion system baseplate subunit TssF [bacterium]
MNRDRLLEYYNRELAYVRRLAWEFAERYPAVAGQLQLEPDKCEDPHVERLIESFSLLTSRIRMRLDDEFPEISDAFLSVLYPHWLAPIPSMTIVQFGLDPDWSREGEGLAIPRGTAIQTRPVDGFRCQFRTTLDLKLFPIAVESIEAIPVPEGEPGCTPDTRGAVRIVLKTLGGQPFRSVGLDAFDFFCDGDPVVAHALHELLFRNPLGIRVRAGEAGVPTRLDAGRIVPVGYERDQGLLPYPPGSNLGYRLLSEYFAFPDKFLFGRIDGLASVAGTADSDRLEISVLLDRFPLELSGKLAPDNLRPGCTPAANLFPKECDPVRLDRTTVEYQILPDVHSRDGYEVHSVLDVSTTSPKTGAVRDYTPFYALKHGEEVADAAFWHAVRRESPREGDQGSDLWITLVDRRHRPIEREVGEVLHVTALCSNRDLPARLPVGPEGDFRIEGKPGVRSLRCLRKPTAAIRPRASAAARWKLVSHLSLNHLSLTDSTARGRFDTDVSGITSGSPGLDAFREMLRLYDHTDSAVAKQRIAGLTSISSQPVMKRIRAGEVTVPARGLEVTFELDQDKFAGSGPFLFASVLERFLGMYASINSFVRTVAKVRQREGVLKAWPPRAGSRSLL